MDRTRELPAKNCFLVPQHEQFDVLCRLAAQHHGRQGQQFSGHLEQQGHITRTCAQDGEARVLPAAMTFRVAHNALEAVLNAFAITLGDRRPNAETC
ncbi:hypothetical protein IOD16_23390 [Saccharothrix sp. 6-C]|uniref:hypothetical protein n=1 Tax=Saccharothrix sp. 6-C TaxID=2781735 RepID=UPI0019174E81|nr:hypothetical protein [Saccharothrix sp. 6-C]QQQ74156.1 hypothetical protein IOD16_23390 [Saccharothrix sp. 6-C]